MKSKDPRIYGIPEIDIRPYKDPKPTLCIAQDPRHDSGFVVGKNIP